MVCAVEKRWQDVCVFRTSPEAGIRSLIEDADCVVGHDATSTNEYLLYGRDARGHGLKLLRVQFSGGDELASLLAIVVGVKGSHCLLLEDVPGDPVDWFRRRD